MKSPVHLRWINIVWILVLGALSLAGAEYICLSCDAAILPTTCSTVRKCGAHEVCFIEAFVNTNGHIRYNLGCRDSQQCIGTSKRRQLMDPFAVAAGDGAEHEAGIKGYAGSDQGDAADVTTVCTECCTGDLCNNNGCGKAGYSEPALRGPVCFSCADQARGDDCDQIAVCGRDEVCMLKQRTLASGNIVVYQSLCESNNTCQHFKVSQNGISTTAQPNMDPCVAQCCREDLCNTGDSNCNFAQYGTAIPLFTTTATSTTTGQPDYCSPNPCLHGTCSVIQGTFNCTCRLGYIGRTCESSVVKPTLAIGQCISNPCHYGTCTDDDNSFLCHCFPGYAGKTCDSLIQTTVAPPVNPCLSNPCLYGLCQALEHSHTYNCTCVHGVFGRQCDQGAIEPYKTSTAAPKPCESNPCKNGTCRDVSDDFVCDCFLGYTGRHCERQRCIPNPCVNGGSCVVLSSSYFCQCKDGYKGENCSTTVVDFVTQRTTGATTPSFNIPMIGLAASMRHPGLFYTTSAQHHGRLYLVDRNGTVVHEYHLDHLNAIGDIAVGPCGFNNDSCLYIADTKHADGWTANILYRISELEVSRGNHNLHDRMSTFNVQFRSSVDRNALMVDEQGTVYFISSDRHLDEFHTNCHGHHLCGHHQSSVNVHGTVTSADISPDGKQVLIMTSSGLYFWRIGPSENLVSALKRPGVLIPNSGGRNAVAWDAQGKNFYIISNGLYVPLYEYLRA